MSTWEPSLGASDEWYTPRYIFEALGCTFDLDVAAPQQGPRHVPALMWIHQNSIELRWSGFIWMNPPFGGRNGLVPWLNKFVEHGNGIALTPDRTSAPWFQDFAGKTDLMLFLSPKVKFERPDGSTGNSPGTGTVLFASGRQGCEALKRAKHLGLLLSRPANDNQAATP